MSALEDKLLRARAKLNALPTLSGALFGTRAFAYARRRIGFAATRALMTSSFHFLEAAALALVLDSPYLAAIVAVRLVSGLASSLLWGLTETLRNDVRRHLGVRDFDRARKRIEEAVARSFWFALILFGVGVAWVVWVPYLAPGVFSVVDAYALALAVRVALSAVTRTYSSGLNAMRRIHRPRWSMILPDFVDVAGLFLFWRLAGPWSITLSLLLSGLLQAFFTMHYARRAYAQVAFAPRRYRVWAALRPAPFLAVRATRYVFASLAFELPTWVVLGFWSRLGLFEGGLLLYAMRPLASFALNVPRLYYVDFIRVRELLRIAEARLLRHVYATAYFALTIVCVAMLGLAFTHTQGVDPFFLAAFFLTLFCGVAFTLEILRSIVFEHEGRAALTTFVVLAALITAAFVELSPTLVLFGAAALLLACVALLRWRSRDRVVAPLLPDRPLPFAQWWIKLRRSQGALTIVIFEIGLDEAAHAPRELAKRLARTKGVSVTRVSKRELLAYAPSTLIDEARWRASTSGVATITHLVHGKNATEAMDALRARTGLPALLRETMSRAKISLDDLRAWVMRTAPAASCLDATKGRCPKAIGSIASVLHALRMTLAHKTPKSIDFGDYELAVYAEQGEATLLVCMPKQMDAAQRAMVRTRLWRESHASAMRA